MMFCYSRHGCKKFLIDSLMRIDNLEENYKEQGKFLNKLSEFAKKTESHIHLVCHPRKPDKDSELSRMDIKGSTLIVNNADNVIIIKRNHEKDKIRRDGPLTKEQDDGMHDLEVISDKQRDGGWIGKVSLRMNTKSLHYFEFKDKGFINTNNKQKRK